MDAGTIATSTNQRTGRDGPETTPAQIEAAVDTVVGDPTRATPASDVRTMHAHRSAHVATRDGEERAVIPILWTALLIVIAIWLLGMLLDVGGDLIHLLLVVAALILVYNLITGRRAD
jgi:hypothetical protein